jgi:uncharacterized protein (TIGR03435 family)
MKTTSQIGAALICALACAAQPPASFEVATVKLVHPSAHPGMIAVDTDPGMVRYSNVTLQTLIGVAYRFDSRLIVGGPAWLDRELYEVSAKLPPGTPKARVPAMLQSLLAERFKLALHRETKEERVYFLVIGKNGPKLKKATPPDDSDTQQIRGEHLPMQMLPDRIIGHAVPLGSLTGALAHPAGYQVVDHTGLAGLFDINLKWTPENSKNAGPDLFLAIQEQLGLKLEPGKGPVETLVIDRAERIPTEN